jgi:hypothetical protein
LNRTDSELVAAARAGDVGSFGELYERHYRMAVGIARSRLSDADLAEGAAQEAFAVACRTLSALQDGDRFPQWLGTICRRTASRLARERPKYETLAEERWSRFEGIGALEHEIVLNPRLDPSVFGLDPPPGYALEKQACPTVTEDELVAYLGAAAAFNDGRFPDSPHEPFDRARFNAASAKVPADRTEAERALIDIRDKFLRREIDRSPVLVFEEDQSASDSFHYVGSNVELGRADRLVAWYRPRNATSYRALYGDLTVKDIDEAELPLKPSGR